MPSGAKKRRALRRKKKAKASKSNVSSPAARSRQGGSDCGELRSPASKSKLNSQHPPVEVEKKEGNSSGNKSLTIGNKELSSPASTDQHNPQHAAVETEKIERNSSGNKSLTIERTEKAAKEKEGNIKIDRGSSSKKPHDKNSTSNSSTEKKAPILESVQPIESLPEKSTHKGEKLSLKTSPIVDSSLEVASRVKNELVVNKNASKDDFLTTSEGVESVLKENGVEKILPLEEKAPAETEYSLASKHPKCPYCGRSSTDDRVNEPDTPGSSERQPLLASAPKPVERTSWKSCCGILELFSGSNT